jgi:hypothetical protein
MGAHMIRRIIVVVVLGLAMMPAMPAEALTKCCSLYVGGTCALYTYKSVRCDMTADVGGDFKNDPKYARCDISAPLNNPFDPNSGQKSSVDFLVFCKNGGQNVAAGVNAIPTIGTPVFSDFVQITKGTGANNQGQIRLDVIVDFSEANAAFEAFCDSQLNRNWDFASAIPCAVTYSPKVTDDEEGTQVLTNVQPFQCVLPVTQCSQYATDNTGPFTHTLVWLKSTNAPEVIQYVDPTTGQPCGPVSQ